MKTLIVALALLASGCAIAGFRLQAKGRLIGGLCFDRRVVDTRPHERMRTPTNPWGYRFWPAFL